MDHVPLGFFLKKLLRHEGRVGDARGKAQHEHDVEFEPKSHATLPSGVVRAARGRAAILVYAAYYRPDSSLSPYS